MKLYNGKWCTLSVLKSDEFHVKSFVRPVRESLSKIRWKGPLVYEASCVNIPVALDVFWLWFRLRLEIKSESYGSRRFVRYEDTHLALIDESLPLKLKQ